MKNTGKKNKKSFKKVLTFYNDRDKIDIVAEATKIT